MKYFLVQFDDGLLHIATKNEVKNINQNDATVLWKPNRTYYAAKILEKGNNKNLLLGVKEKYEEDNSKSLENVKNIPYNKENKPEDEATLGKVATKNEIKNIKQNDATVLWKPNETNYSAKILEKENDENLLLGVKEKYEEDNSKSLENVENIPDNTVNKPEDESTLENVEIEQIDFSSSFILSCGLDTNISLTNLESALNAFEINTAIEGATEDCVESTEGLISLHSSSPTENSNKSDSKKKIIVHSNVEVNSATEQTHFKSYSPKLQYCQFCNKTVKRFWRHLILIHKNENEVKAITALEKKSKERRCLIDTLRKKGNYIFNQKNKFEQIVSRRAIHKPLPIEYTDCPTCLVRISKITLRRHFKNCDPKSSELNKRKTVALSRKVTLKLHEMADPILIEHIFPFFKNDEVSNTLRQDYLAILYGNKLVKMHTSTHHYKMIRAHLRYVGKFVVEIKKISNSITDFKSCFKTIEYDNCTMAIRSVAKFNKDEGQFAAPNTAFTLGTILKFCAAILETDYIKKGDEPNRIEVENFLKLLQRELTTDINKTAIENQKAIRRQQKVTLPLTSDLKKLLNYLRVERQKSYSILNQEFTFERWKRLASFTLVGILVYNGRRPGEIERLTTEDFKLSCQSLSDVYEHSKNDLDMNQGYERCALRGKKGRNVSIVLHSHEIICINKVLFHRNDAKVNPKNPYVFGLPSTKPFKYLSSSILLKKFAHLAELDFPERIFATNIRKNLATKTTDLQLNSDEREHIMNFMGHSETVHKNIYRQPDAKKDILVMPKILNFVSGNSKVDTRSADDSKVDDSLPKPRRKLFCNESITEKNDESVVENPDSRPSDSDLLEFVSEDNDNSVEIPDSRPNDSDLLEFVSEDNDNSVDDPDFRPNDSDIENNSDSHPNCSAESDIENETHKKKRKLMDISLGYIPRRSWESEERRAAEYYFFQHIKTSESPSLEACKNVINKCEALNGRTPNQLKAYIVNKFKSGSCTKEITGKRRSWTTPEKKICRKEFGEEISRGLYPSSARIQTVLKEYPQFKGRTREMVIAHIQHCIKKKKNNNKFK